VKYTCIPGFKVTDDGNSSVIEAQCLQGQWNINNKQCTRKNKLYLL